MRRGIPGLAVLLAILLAAAWSPAPAADDAIGRNTNPTPLTLDYSSCVALALRQSPLLTRSALEIEIRDLDVSDSRWSFIPPVTVNSSYYFNTPNRDRTTSLNFSVGPYNPVESYFSLKATKLVKKIAIFAHQSALSRGLRVIGDRFLELATLERRQADQTEMIGLARQKLSYVRNRLGTGAAAGLEVQVASQEVVVAEAEVDRTAAQREALTERLRAMLGLPPGQRPSLALKDANRQVLGAFSPRTATYEQVEASAPELKIQQIKNELQELRIYLAYVKFLPTVTVGVRNPDALGGSGRDQDLYAFVGVDLTLWSGMKHTNDVTRQKLLSRQLESEGGVQQNDLRMEWLEARGRWEAAVRARKLAGSAEELARLKVRQAEIGATTGPGQPWPALTEARRVHLEARMKLNTAELEQDQAALQMRTLTGDLFREYINVATPTD